MTASAPSRMISNASVKVSRPRRRGSSRPATYSVALRLASASLLRSQPSTSGGRRRACSSESFTASAARSAAGPSRKPQAYIASLIRTIRHPVGQSWAQANAPAASKRLHASISSRTSSWDTPLLRAARISTTSGTSSALRPWRNALSRYARVSVSRSASAARNESMLWRSAGMSAAPRAGPVHRARPKAAATVTIQSANQAAFICIPSSAATL